MPVVQRSGKPTLHYIVDDHTDPWKNAPYIFLQHGNGRSSQFWYSWIPYLSRFYKVLRPDARGLGRSPVEFDVAAGVTVDALVEDLAAICDAVGAETVHFCGESMGGILGLAFSALEPSRVRTLTLVSTPMYISDRMKETYSMGHASRMDAMKAWAGTRGSRQPIAARVSRRTVTPGSSTGMKPNSQRPTRTCSSPMRRS